MEDNKNYELFIQALKDARNPEPLKISVYSIEYYVNKKKKRVRCHMEYNIKGPDHVIDAIFPLMDVCKMPNFEVTAEARLDPQDTFDVEIGKKVARAKAESMAYRQFSNGLLRIANKLLGTLESIDDFMIKADNVIEHNDKYLATF